MDEIKPGSKLFLQDFPPKLRKVALYIAKEEPKPTLKEACEKTGVNYDSAKTLIYKARQKGKDFNELLNEVSFNYLRSRVYEVDENLARQAISPSQVNPKFLELFYKRMGLLKDAPLVQIDNRSLTVVVSPSVIAPSIPKSVKDSLPPEDVSEIEIEGPKRK